MDKKKSGRASKDKAEILQFRNALRGGENPFEALSRARELLPPEFFREATAWIHATPVIARKVLPTAFPPTLEQFEDAPTLKPISPEREFRWATAFLLPHVARLREFVIHSVAFQRAFLADQFTTCAAVLDDIEQRFGQSFWLIKKRLLLLQAANGLEAQKQYMRHVRSRGAHGLLEFIAYFTSVRIEPSRTPRRFFTQVDAEIRKHNLPAGLASQLRFHVRPSLTDPRALAEILCREQAGAILDYYEALVCLTQSAAATGHIDFRSVLLPVITTFYAQTEDSRLGAILAATGVPPPGLPPAHPAALTAADALLQGDYARASADALTALAADPADADALMLAARASAMLPDRPDATDRPLIQRLVSHAAGVIAKDASVSKDFVELHKVALGFFGTSWANTLLGIIEQEGSTEPLMLRGGYVQLAGSSIPTVHPLRISWLQQGEARERYAHHAQALLGSSYATTYALATADARRTPLLPEQILWEERTLLEATQSFASGGFVAALEVAHRLKKSTHSYYKYRAVRLACPSLLRLGQTEQCIDLLTTAYVQERIPHDMLPIRAAAHVVAADEERTLAGNLSVPILFELHTRHIGNQYDSECMFACVEFLEAHGLQRPSSLRKVHDRFDWKKLVYFLRYVCVESIMDRSSMFDSSRELLEERLDICRLLIELDADGVEAYHTEIKALLRRLMLQKRMKEVEQSKIFVDTDSIKRTVAEDLREEFNRYLALRAERLEFRESPEVESALMKASSGDLQELVSLALPKNETSELFESIIRRLQDEYLLSPEHGLDKYLSVRIRHGTLAAHLRKSVENHKLITLREVGSGEYKKNEHWPKRIKTASPAVRDELIKRLATFSRDFDKLVEDVKARIQIRKTLDGTGLFEFLLSDQHIRLFSELITPELTFDQFVDHVLEWFGGALELQLVGVRDYVTLVAKTRAGELLEQLATDIEKFSDKADTGGLTNAIRTAKTELQVAFDRVAAWFRRARIVANEPFPLEDAIDIGAETVRTVAQDFRPEVLVSGDTPLLLRGLLLATFVDIFFIIFENIVRHAATNSLPVARVSVTSSERRIHIRVENDLEQGVASPEARAKIAAIKAAMKEGRHVASVNREGGTGLHKLGKLLAHDLESDPDLDFGFSDDTRFFVRFSTSDTIRAPSTPHEDPDRRG